VINLKIDFDNYTLLLNDVKPPIIVILMFIFDCILQIKLFFCMKFFLVFVLFISAIRSYGQKITGVITDISTGRPIHGASVSLGASRAYTNPYGSFEIANANGNDSLKISHIGYKTCMMPLSKDITTLRIELEPTVISLKEVTIYGDKDFKQDSISNRLAFQKQFNYTSPKLMDAFNGNPNKMTGELISVNPFTLIAVLTKKSAPEYKFKKMLITDEHEDYVTRKFNKGIVSRITGLKGDTLSEFLTRYRPGYQFALKAADYDMEVYIRASFEKFRKDGFLVSDPFHDAANENAGAVKLEE